LQTTSEMAKQMLREGVSMETVARISGFSIEELKKLL
jgi:hypothetical protein